MDNDNTDKGKDKNTETKPSKTPERKPSKKPERKPSMKKAEGKSSKKAARKASTGDKTPPPDSGYTPRRKDTRAMIEMKSAVINELGDEYYVKHIKLPFFIHLVYLFSPYWEWLMTMQICTSYFCITYSMIFALYIPTLYRATKYMDIVFVADTFIRLAVEIWRRQTEIPCIIFLVPYTFGQFCMDMFSLLPVEAAFIGFSATKTITSLKYYDYFRVNRFLRFSRAFKFFTVVVNERRLSAILMFIVKYMTQYLIFLQFVACVFFWVLPADPVDFMLYRRRNEVAGSWIRTVDREKPQYGKEHFDHFALSVSFAAAVVTTTGYGDFSGTTSLEMGIMAMMMLTGAILLSGFFSSGLASFLLEHDGARFDLFFRVDAIRAHLVNIKAHKIYAQKVIEYYNLLWNYREGVYDVGFIGELPRSVIEDLYYDITTEMFHKSQLFRGLDESFLREVAGIVHVVIYNPKMMLCTIGGYAMNMYYLLQGEVIIKSKLDSRCNGAILRAGCIIGEVNLFFSYPYTTTIETINCCQLLQIRKFELFNIFESYPNIVSVLRRRIQRRLVKAHRDYETIGQYPICWVEKQTKPGHKDFSTEFPVEVRSAYGFNRRITGDVTDDTNLMIIDMPCLDKSYVKQHNKVYQSCVLPPILTADNSLPFWWNVAVMIVSMYSACMAPYCPHFTSRNEVVTFLCHIDPFVEIVFSLIYFMDVLIEICYCCPVSGIYYKFKDGLALKITEVTFWIDVFSSMPLGLVNFIHGDNLAEKEAGFSVSTVFNVILQIAIILRILRLWKIVRFFSYLDNARPESLFVYRLIQSMISIIYSTHVVACYLYSFACFTVPGTKTVICHQQSWLRSFTEGKTGFAAEIRHDMLGKTEGYWVAYYFACATVTSSGFGDFNPQTRTEMIFLAGVQLISFCITGYYTALLTSALSCTVRPKLTFQQKLVGVRQFLEHKGLDEALQKRILEHYYLQDVLWKGVSLPENVYHYLYDTPEYINEDAIYLEIELHFDGVPIFTKLDPKLLVSIAKLIRRYLVPPGVIFLRKGEVRRQMYIIGRGSVAVLSDKDQTVPLNVIEETGHFGIRDLLFGEPAHHDIKTLSYCIFFEVELRDLFESMRGDTDLMHSVEEEKEKLQPGIDAMLKLFSYRNRTTQNDSLHSIPSFIDFPRNKDDNKPYCSYEEYEEVFNGLKRPRFWRFILMRRTIHPVGMFAKIWVCFMSLVAALNIAMMVAEVFGGRRNSNHLYIMWDLIGAIDIYFKLHWAYYKESNMLISHPLKTATRYIFKGEFVFDLFVTAPFELIVPVMTGTHLLGYSKTAGWHSKLRWTRFGQVMRIPAIVVIFHNIFKMRKFLLLVSYIAITLFICTILASFAETNACPVGETIFKEGDQNRLPFCKQGTYMRVKESFGINTPTSRWIVGIYYVSQGMFSVGFGDITTLSVGEMKLLIFVCFFGFAILRCILSDITAAEVDIDEVRHNYLEQILCLKLIMLREKVPKKIRRSVLSYMYHTWDLSKGLQPRQLFSDLHPALEADLFRVVAGDSLTKIPIFHGLRENVLRTICQYMNTLFFRKGERITRFGNMELEMYIIVKGQVWIADRFLVWTQTLEAGQSFGESSIVYFTRRNYNAIAACDVEVFVLGASDFEVVIQRYPTLLSEIQGKLLLPDSDIFQTGHIKDQTAENVKQISSHIKTLLERNSEPDPDEEEIYQHVREGWFRSILTMLWATGEENENLSFFYFTKSTSASVPFLLHPKCGFLNWFDSLVIGISYVSPALAAYNMVFKEEVPSEVGEWIRTLTFAMEVPMYLHILLQFFIPFTLVNGKYCKNLLKIAFNYIVPPGAFLVDVIASAPIRSNIGVGDPARFLGLLRFLRLFYFYRTQLAKSSDLRTSVFKHKVSLSMSTFMLVINGIACYFYSLAICTCTNSEKKINCGDGDIYEMCRAGTWTYEFVFTHELRTLRRLQPWRWYVRSLYWVITTVSTTGFGDITPINAEEARLAIFTIFCGAFIISVILSSFASGISSLNKTYREYLYKVNLLLKHMGNIGMSNERRHQVISYFVMRWERCRGVKYSDCTSALPTTMGTSVCYFLYFPVASKCKLFTNGLDSMFMRELCAMFTHEMFIPGITIVNEGYLETIETNDGADSIATGRMFLVYRGRVSSYTKDKEGREFLVETYGDGEVFAKGSVLFYDLAYTKSYRAETYTEVLGLSQSDVLHLVDSYDGFANNMLTLMMDEYPRIKNVSIFENREKSKKKGDRESHSSTNISGAASATSFGSGGTTRTGEEAPRGVSPWTLAFALAKQKKAQAESFQKLAGEAM